MPPPHEQDAAMRKEALATLNANPAASYDTVLANWRYRRGETIDEAEASRVAAIYEQERDAQAERHATAGRRSWWRFWQ